uniref:Uncharacterized protein n=1 Tax=Arundo donax TaxID=35708 RepID=A0A0A9BYV6_ARUDO
MRFVWSIVKFFLKNISNILTKLKKNQIVSGSARHEAGPHVP